MSADRYDKHFEKYSKQWMRPYHWHWLKAQGYQESLLEPDARSHVGAEGVMQFMPGTWKEVSKAMKWGVISPKIAERSIEAGAYYMRTQLRGWHTRRPASDRLFLAQSGYNAGRGHLYKAQKLCGNKNLYDEIIVCLPQVTGRHSKETITYVKRIRKWRAYLR